MIFLMKLVASALPNMCLLMKLMSSALPNVLMSANHWYWITRTDNIFEIVDNIVSADFMLSWSMYESETREILKFSNMMYSARIGLWMKQDLLIQS